MRSTAVRSSAKRRSTHIVWCASTVGRSCQIRKRCGNTRSHPTCAESTRARVMLGSLVLHARSGSQIKSGAGSSTTCLPRPAGQRRLRMCSPSRFRMCSPRRVRRLRRRNRARLLRFHLFLNLWLPRVPVGPTCLTSPTFSYPLATWSRSRTDRTGFEAWARELWKKVAPE